MTPRRSVTPRRCGRTLRASDLALVALVAFVALSVAASLPRAARSSEARAEDAASRTTPASVTLTGNVTLRYGVEGAKRRRVEDEVDQDLLLATHLRLLFDAGLRRPIAVVADLDYYDDVDGTPRIGQVTADLFTTYRSGRYMFMRAVYLELAGVLHPALDLRIGRQRVWSIAPVTFDGVHADLRHGRRLGLQAYVGRLHHFYASADPHVLVAGGEVSVRPCRGLALWLRDLLMNQTNRLELEGYAAAAWGLSGGAAFTLLNQTPWEARGRVSLSPLGWPVDLSVTGYAKITSEDHGGRTDLEYDGLRRGGTEDRPDRFLRFQLGFLAPYARVDARATIALTEAFGLFGQLGVRRLLDAGHEAWFNGRDVRVGGGLELDLLRTAGIRCTGSYLYAEEEQLALGRRRHVVDGQIRARLADGLEASVGATYEAGHLVGDSWDALAFDTEVETRLADGVRLRVRYAYEQSNLLLDREQVRSWHRGVVEVRWVF